MVNEETGYIGGTSNVNIINTHHHYANIPGELGDSLIVAPNNQFYTEYEFDKSRETGPLLYKTINGGIDWQEIETPFKIRIRDMQFINEHVGYVVSEGEGVYKTENGGITWTKILSEVVHYYHGMCYVDPFSTLCFVDEQNGFIYDGLNNSGILLRTNNGGQSWECLSLKYPSGVAGKYPSLFDDLNKVLFPESSQIAYVLTNNQLHKTNNNGNDWEKIYESDSKLQALFITSNTGYLFNDGLVTNNGGATWETYPILNLAANAKITTVNQEEFYYISNNKIIKTISGDPQAYFMTSEMDGQLTDLCFPSENTGYAIGAGNLLLKYEKKTED